MLSSTKSGLCFLVALVILAASYAGAIVITEPSQATFWSNATDAVNTMVWSLLPATYPPPQTQYFDIYLRNAAPGMYSPGINISLATRIDSQMGTSINLTDITRFRAGGGYQLFLSDPADASIVYCGSDVFAIVSPTLFTPLVSSESTTTTSSDRPSSRSGTESTAPLSSTPTATSTVTSSDIPANLSTTVSPSANQISSASSAQTSASSVSSNSQQSQQSSSATTSGSILTISTTETTTTTVVLTQSATASQSSAFHSSRRPPHSLMPAIAPGSPQDQGFNLSGAASTATLSHTALAFSLLSALSLLLPL